MLMGTAVYASTSLGDTDETVGLEPAHARTHSSGESKDWRHPTPTGDHDGCLRTRDTHGKKRRWRLSMSVRSHTGCGEGAVGGGLRRGMER